MNIKSEIFKNCRTEEEENLSNYIIYTVESDFTNKYPEKAGKIYATILYQVLYTDIDKVKKADRIYHYIDTDFIFPEKNYMLFNALLHFIHQNFPNARANGVGYIASIREDLYEENLNIEVKFSNLQCYLDEFPENLKQEIEEILKPIMDDLCVNYTTTWMYSHIDCGDDYCYKNNEHPRMEIYYPAKEVEETLLSILKKGLKNYKIIISQDLREIYRNY